MTREELIRAMEEQAQITETVESKAPESRVIKYWLDLVKELDGLRPIPSPWLVSVEKAARMMDVKPRWLYDRKRVLPFIHKLGDGTLRVSVPDLQQWLDRNRTTRV